MALRLAALLALALGAGLASAAGPVRVPEYSVFEQAIRASGARENVTLAGPAGRNVEIGGFDAGDGTWRFRFAPTALGNWTWRANISGGTDAVSRTGSFVAVRGSSPGFVRRSPYNRFRWTFTNGSAFSPLGMEDCTVSVHTPNPLDDFGFDGGSGVPPRWVTLEPYLDAYAAAGFDLFRWGPDNCSFSLAGRIDPAGNVYSAENGALADQLVSSLRRHGFRIEFVLFGSPPFPNGATGPELAATERYVRYVVDRYGASVDFWELTNESSPPTAWIAQIAAYLHRIDPYRHPIGTSWSRPELPGIDFGSDHWYQTEGDLDSDLVTWQRLRSEAARRYGKPTLVDEQGNSGHNWDPTSGVRMRLRAWAAFFAEATLVFWNTSGTKDYTANAGNVYIGPQERGYIRVLASYLRGFDPRARVVSTAITGATGLRAYALGGPREYALYLVDGASHTQTVTGAKVAVDPARPGRATWIDPSTGRTLASAKAAAGRQTLTVPPFVTDVALKIAS
jgi:hypothetical protein